MSIYTRSSRRTQARLRKKEALKIYHNENMEAGERFERIRKTLETYKMPITILPKAVREFMEEEEDASNL